MKNDDIELKIIQLMASVMILTGFVLLIGLILIGVGTYFMIWVTDPIVGIIVTIAISVGIAGFSVVYDCVKSWEIW